MDAAAPLAAPTRTFRPPAASEPEEYGASARVELPAGPGEFELHGTASKQNVPLGEVPASVSVLTEERMRERGVVDLQQALTLLPGVVPTFTYGGFQAIRLRGFQALTLFDGRRDPRPVLAESAPQVGVFDIDRVELLRGPAALLYGYGAVGGVVNLIRKRPARTARYEVDVGLGLPNQHVLRLGAQGPVGSDLAYRLDLAHVAHENFRGQRTRRNQATSALRYTPSRKHSLGVRVSYAIDHYNTDVGLPTVEDPGRPGTWHLPPHTRLENRYATQNDHLDYQRLELALDYRYQFTQRSKLEARAAITRDYYDYLAAEMLSYQPATDAMAAQVARESLWFRRRWTPIYGQLELHSDKRTGPLRHQLVLGYQLDLLRGLSQRGGARMTGNGMVTDNVQFAHPVDFTHPVDNSPRVAFERKAYDHYRYLVHSIYAFDHIHLRDNLIATGGVRLDILRIRTQRELVDAETDATIPDPSTGRVLAPNRSEESALTGQFGVVYTPWHPTTVYASYASAYSPQLVSPGATTVEDYEPERSQQFEGGLRVRGTRRGHMFSLDSAGFLIRKKNLVIPRGPDEFLQAGKVESRGLDLSVQYRPPAWLQLDVGYAFTDAHYLRFASEDPVREETADRSGNEVPFAPRHSGNVWLRLVATENVGLGVGSRFTSEQFADSENRLPLPRAVLLDASVWFGNERATFTIAATNLLDKHDYYSSAINTWAVNPQLTPGPGRELLGTLRLQL